MKNNKVRSKKREYDTYSITMELEKPLLYEEEQEEIYKRQKNIKRKSRNKKIVKLTIRRWEYGRKKHIYGSDKKTT